MLAGGTGGLGLEVGNKAWSRAWLYRTMDGGHSWERVALDGLRSIGYLRLFDTLHTVVVDEADGAVYTTDDGGPHWQRGVLPPHAPGHLPAFFISPLEGWLLARAEGEGSVPYHTSDGGKSWEKLSVPSSLDYPNSVSFHDAQTGWISQQGQSGSALFGTGDGGRTWAASQLPRPSKTGIMLGLGPVVTFGNRALLPLVVTEGSQGVGSPESVYVYSSEDRGQHWSGPLAAWSGKAMLSGHPVLALASPTVWAIAAGGTIRLSQDGGRSWAERLLDPSGAYAAMDAVFPSPAEGYLLFRRSPNSQCLRACMVLRRTVDGGARWEQVTLPELPTELPAG
jgi:photosystem II stability/assembly factor-like uncharacterized protein